VKQCIESVLKSLSLNKKKAKIVIVDDDSPEKALSSWLQTLSDNPNITVLKNRHNLGFIGSVNRGIKHHVESDVLMLNADTMVQGNWLDRLLAALYNSDDIASVVPWSNNSEITSLIKMAAATASPSKNDLAIIDETAANLHRQGILRDIEIPSCIGFAMLMRRSVMNEIGSLDDVDLVRGYGEEVDWCMRARDASYRHVVATGVFVAHVGTVSFRFEKTLRVKQNKEIIHQRYPKYELEYILFQRDDPLKEARLSLIDALEKKNIDWIKNAKRLLSISIEDSFDSKISLKPDSLSSIALPAALPSSYLRIAVWDHRINRQYAEKILRLARLISSQNDVSIRLLIVGEANEALWHTGVVDVIPKMHTTHDSLIGDITLLGLANCRTLLYFQDEKLYAQNTGNESGDSLGISMTSVNDEFDPVSWLAHFKQAYQLKIAENH
jgi:GT2 family glycosyltransferase